MMLSRSDQRSAINAWIKADPGTSADMEATEWLRRYDVDMQKTLYALAGRRPNALAEELRLEAGLTLLRAWRKVGP